MLPQANMTVNVPKHDGKLTLDKGFFVIDVDHDKKDIQVQYYEGVQTHTGIRSGKIRMVFRGKTGIDLYRAILNHDFIAQLDHAAYLGYELARAEAALKEGKRFIQDRIE